MAQSVVWAMFSLLLVVLCVDIYAKMVVCLKVAVFFDFHKITYIANIFLPQACNLNDF